MLVALIVGTLWAAIACLTTYAFYNLTEAAKIRFNLYPHPLAELAWVLTYAVAFAIATLLFAYKVLPHLTAA